MRTSVIAVLSLAILLAVPSGFAQQRLEANVPFDFIVNNKVMPAGEYNIDWPSVGSDVAIVRNIKATRSAAAITSPAGRPKDGESPALVFHRYGDTHYLKLIRTQTDERQLPKSRGEKEALAARATAVNTTVVARGPGGGNER